MGKGHNTVSKVEVEIPKIYCLDKVFIAEFPKNADSTGDDDGKGNGI